MKRQFKSRYLFLKKYELDMWGYLVSSTNVIKKKKFDKLVEIALGQMPRMPNFLFYSLYPKIDVGIRLLYTVYIHQKFDSRHISDYIRFYNKIFRFRVFYGNMTIKKLRRHLKTFNQKWLNYSNKVLLLLESRLDVLLYRLNFFKNPKEARIFVKNKIIYINDKLIKRPNYYLHLYDLISFRLDWQKKFYNKLLYRMVVEKTLIWNYPRYFECNFRLMRYLLIDLPTFRTVPNLSTIDWNFIRCFI